MGQKLFMVIRLMGTCHLDLKPIRIMTEMHDIPFKHIISLLFGVFVQEVGTGSFITGMLRFIGSTVCFIPLPDYAQKGHQINSIHFCYSCLKVNNAKQTTFGWHIILLILSVSLQILSVILLINPVILLIQPVSVPIQKQYDTVRLICFAFPCALTKV